MAVRTIKNNEFMILKSSRYSVGGQFVVLGFEGQQKGMDLVTNIKLTIKEWENLLEFLKKTQDKKLLPSDCLGYGGYFINEDKVYYYKPKLRIKQIEAALDTVPEKQVLIEEEKRACRGVKKTQLTDFCVLEYGNVKVVLSRQKFLRFRTFALNAHKQLSTKN